MALILRLSIIPRQGTPMMYELLAFDFVFDDMGNDVAGIASLGDNADFFLAIGQVIGQVDAAVAVPDQLDRPAPGWQSRVRSSWAWFPCGKPMTMSTLHSLSSRSRFLYLIDIF
jgi:hypothetical protein